VTIRIQISRNAVILMLLYASLLCFSTANGLENPDAGVVWKNFATRYTTVLYQDDADLQTFHEKIQSRPADWSIRKLFSQTEKEDNQKQISRNIDLLFERVQEILDMHKKMPRITIRIYPDKKALRQAYMEIYQEECRIRAWYRYKDNSVYLTVADLQAGMLAHELAHAIIDHYLVVKPPAASAEILARYVDSHLHP